MIKYEKMFIEFIIVNSIYTKCFAISKKTKKWTGKFKQTKFLKQVAPDSDGFPPGPWISSNTKVHTGLRIYWFETGLTLMWSDPPGSFHPERGRRRPPGHGGVCGLLAVLA